MDLLGGGHWSAAWRPEPSSALIHLIPYAILMLNYLFFKLLRTTSASLINYLSQLAGNTDANEQRQHRRQKNPTSRWIGELAKLLADELISTCELCADCAELNVVYERHGSLAYGLSLFALTYLVWLNTFGEAHTTPGYLMEELCLVKGKQLWFEWATYARLAGQLVALPLAWRFASIYWTYELMPEHRALARPHDCRSSLATSTASGLLVELTCSLLCRLCELICQQMHRRGQVSARTSNLANASLASVLVVLALELSGGYLNPILAASLEFGCAGIQVYQHALVFWLGPLLGHLGARLFFEWLVGGQPAEQTKRTQQRRSSTRHRRNRKTHDQ